MTIDIEYTTVNYSTALPISLTTYSNATDLDEQGKSSGGGRNFLALFLPLIPLLTITGNILVVAAVLREKSLQSITNYFIVSLAIADFLVALVVMPFAVYVEVVHMNWGLGQAACNLYISADVCASTASILNLVAISVDRYIAITRPIQYSRHGNNKRRASLTIIIVWTASITTALPILLGINELHDETRCEFTQAAYIVVSSLISFFCPCIIMIILYAIILKRLHDRQKMAKNKKVRRITAGKSKDCGHGSRPNGKGYGPTVGGLSSMAAAFGGNADALLKSAKLVKQIGERLEAKGEGDTTFDSLSTTNSTSEDEFRTTGGGSVRIKRSPVDVKPIKHSKTLNNTTHSPVESTQRILSEISTNTGFYSSHYSNIGDEPTSSQAVSQNCQTTTEPLVIHSFGDDLELIPFIDSTSRPSSMRYKRGAPIQNLESIEEFPKTPGSSFKLNKPLSSNSPFRSCSLKIKPVNDDSSVVVERQQKTFNDSFRSFRRHFWSSLTSGFRLQRIKQTSRRVAKREHRQIRKEQKATQTLAVVLAVFLICWVPFFTCHFTNAMCILKNQKSCIPFLAFFLTTWLGYMNSFMNPIIYTIFNPEYRKAFRKILLFWRRNSL